MGVEDDGSVWERYWQNTAYITADHTPGAGAQLGRRQGRRFVDEDLALVQEGHRRGELGPVQFVQAAGPQAGLVDLPEGREQAHHKLHGRHLHAEHGHGFLALDGRVLGDVHGKGGLAHRGTPGHDDQIGILQARRHLVEIFVAGRDASDLALVFVQFLDALDRLVEGGLYRHVAGTAALTLVRDGEDQALGFFQQFLARAAFQRKGAGGDLGTHVDQLAQDRLLADDFGIGPNIGGAGGARGELDGVAAAVDLVHQAVRREPVGRGDRVTGLAGVAELRDGAEDHAVIFAVEIRFGDDVRHRVPGPGREE